MNEMHKLYSTLCIIYVQLDVFSKRLVTLTLNNEWRGSMMIGDDASLKFATKLHV